MIVSGDCSNFDVLNGVGWPDKEEWEEEAICKMVAKNANGGVSWRSFPLVTALF